MAGEGFNLVVEGQAVTLNGEQVTVGRGPENHVVIDDPTVSQLHAAIARVGGAHVVTDLGSRNGTHVNGERILGSRGLRPGDEIRVGRARLVYRADLRFTRTETKPVDPPPDVTARERDVLVELCRPLASGTVFTQPATATEIGRALFISEAAARMHISRLFKKFGVDPSAPDRRAVLATTALDRGAVRIVDLTNRG